MTRCPIITREPDGRYVHCPEPATTRLRPELNDSFEACSAHIAALNRGEGLFVIGEVTRARALGTVH